MRIFEWAAGLGRAVTARLRATGSARRAQPHSPELSGDRSGAGWFASATTVSTSAEQRISRAEVRVALNGGNMDDLLPHLSELIGPGRRVPESVWEALDSGIRLLKAHMAASSMPLFYDRSLPWGAEPRPDNLTSPWEHKPAEVLLELRWYEAEGAHVKVKSTSTLPHARRTVILEASCATDSVSTLAEALRQESQRDVVVEIEQLRDKLLGSQAIRGEWYLARAGDVPYRLARVQTDAGAVSVEVSEQLPNPDRPVS